MISPIVSVCNNFQTRLFYLPDGRCYGKDPFSIVPPIFVSLFFPHNLHTEAKETLSKSNGAMYFK